MNVVQYAIRRAVQRRRAAVRQIAADREYTRFKNASGPCFFCNRHLSHYASKFIARGGHLACSDSDITKYPENDRWWRGDGCHTHEHRLFWPTWAYWSDG